MEWVKVFLSIASRSIAHDFRGISARTWASARTQLISNPDLTLLYTAVGDLGSRLVHNVRDFPLT